MIARLLLAAGAMLLVGASDGHRWENQPQKHRRVVVTLVTYDSRAELRAAARKRGHTKGHIQGFARWRGNKCEIHIIDPKVCYVPQVIGHELLHCTHGAWHPRMDARDRAGIKRPWMRKDC